MLPETGIKPEEPRVRVGHRLRGPLAVLHEHLRRAQHPRPCAGGRDRCRAGPSRPARVGDRRRRRHAVDRRQPPDPRAAPQRQPQDPDVQQPDLRPDEGPVLADERDRQGHEVDAVRFARPPVQPDLGRVGRGGDVRRPHARHGPQAHDRGVPPGQRAPRGRRSSRCTRTATSSTTVRSTRSSTRTPGPTCSSTSKHGEPVRFGAEQRDGRRDERVRRGARSCDVDDVGEDRLVVHDETPPRPVAGVRAVAAGRAPGDADAGRRVPRRRPCRRTRSRCSSSWSRPSEKIGPGRPRGLAALRLRPGRSTRPLEPRTVRSCGTPSRSAASG